MILYAGQWLVDCMREHRQIGRKADLHSDVPNEHPLVIQKILSHLNTKNDVLFYLYSDND
jgi:hypothetical protein